MLTISLTFTAGRFSATPWGHHVNEGAVEWPPSPWRLLRGLAAVWKNTAPDVSEADFMTLATKLSETLQYYLPPAGTAHTRHYMPIGELKKVGREKTALIFDTCVTVDRKATLQFQWPSVTLTDEEETLLALLLSRLPYLGRAESWVAARVEDADDRIMPPNARPLTGDASPEFNEEAVSMLVPDAPLRDPNKTANLWYPEVWQSNL